MEKTLLELLKKLEKKIPPPAKHHHNITFCQFGSDVETIQGEKKIPAGWEDKLGLNVWLPDARLQTFFLDDSDLESPDTLIADIKADVEKLMAGDEKAFSYMHPKGAGCR